MRLYSPCVRTFGKRVCIEPAERRQIDGGAFAHAEGTRRAGEEEHVEPVFEQTDVVHEWNRSYRLGQVRSAQHARRFPVGVNIIALL